VDKSQAALVGDGTALSDTNWHQMNVRFSNSADQNTLIFRLDRASDGTSTPGATIATNNGGIAEIGVDKTGGGYQEALNGRIAEILIYAGTGVIVSSGDVTTNETYLNCRYGL
jgi:hypothetical protein